MKRTYRILEGVRRAKAAQLAGHATIWAEIAGHEADKEAQVAVDLLLSPKKEIRISSRKERLRWESIRDGMAEEPDLFPPIIIRRGARGTLISEVLVIDEGAFEDD